MHGYRHCGTVTIGFVFSGFLVHYFGYKRQNNGEIHPQVIFWFFLYLVLLFVFAS